jgi:ferredoxin
VEIAPEAFRLDDHAVVIGGATDDALMVAAEGCPVEAITLLDEDTGEQVYP